MLGVSSSAYRLAPKAIAWLALALWPAAVQAQEGCRIVKRASTASSVPAMAALAAVNFGMEGHVRAVLVDTAVRESHHLAPEDPERLPIVAVVRKAEVAALTSDSLPFAFAAYEANRTASDTARVVLIRLAPGATSSARNTDWIPHTANRQAIIVYLYGRPFPANFLAHVIVRRTGTGWVAERMACREE
jgi:hypothetical protein